MKSEKQFIFDMWKQVDRMEQEVIEKEQAFDAARRLLLRDVIIALFMIITSVILVLLHSLVAGTVYITAFIIIVAAFIADSVISSQA